MKIESAKVIVCSPGRNFVTLKIATDDGLYGIGDATVNGREKAVVAYLEEHVIPTLIGRDASQIEDTWQYLYRGAYWRRGPVTMAAISAVDLALWDIKGKAANMPLYQLLGGASRKNIMIYCHAQGMTIEEAVDAVAAKKDQGFVAIRASKSAFPGYHRSMASSGRSNQAKGGMVDALPHEETWSSPKYLAHVPQLFAKLRETFGDDLHLLHDAHHRLTPIEAARLGKNLEPFHNILARRPNASRVAGGFSAYPATYDHTARPGRSLQYNLGRASSH